MEVYTTIPADAIAELDEWHAAFASMQPTEAEVEQERAYWAEQRRQEDYADYLAAEAKAAAEEAEAEEEAAAAAASRRSANYRSKRDGLTQDERASLREPTRYEVEEVGPGHWWAAHRDCEAIFAATRVPAQAGGDGRAVRITSNTGGQYLCRVEDDYSVSCPCKHAEKLREWGTGALCKHGAVTVAVADHCRARDAAAEQPVRLAA